MFVCLINLVLLFPSIVLSELVCARRRPDAHAPIFQINSFDLFSTGGGGGSLRGVCICFSLHG